jgi:rfaE bifunctional protein nucleotidyltransferase chain/domain
LLSSPWALLLRAFSARYIGHPDSDCTPLNALACSGGMHLLFSVVAMSAQKIKTLNEIVRLRPALRESGKKLVFTNGCFDILHVGHVRYLNHARSLGDLLVVGINSDRSVREIKGDSRPIVSERERAEVLAALACVDFVFIFDDPTPKQVIDAIVPDILVKGADWGLAEIVGRDTVEKAGGTVLNVPLVKGSSTSDIIRKVLERFGNRNCQSESTETNI